MSAGETEPIRLAIMAVGGQGGAVLTGWIVALAEAEGYAVQATSVAGVAQRTGATIYYIETMRAGDRRPVFALAPSPGDVDILIAAEWMEAGRAILRGFVTPERTLLIASTHRALAVAEKIAPGDGRGEAGPVREAAARAARRLVAFDMERVARDAGSVISASLFGALAGSGALPFPPEAFREAIRASGRGVGPSLAAFEAALARAMAGDEGVAPGPLAGPAAPPPLPRALAVRLAALPAGAEAMAGAGLRLLLDYQDEVYGAEYLDRLEAVAAHDPGQGGHILTREAAKHVANAMAYDDVIRVADLKTRDARLARLSAEADGAEVVRVTDFFHPRAEEIASLMPAGLGRRVAARPQAMRFLAWLAGRGHRLRTDRVLPFLMLRLLAGLRRVRRRLLRHEEETRHFEAWLAAVLAEAPRNPALAVEMLRARRLVKGYADTHARGLAKFDRAMAGMALVRHRPDAADWAARLNAAAREDPEGTALDGALATIRSFADQETIASASASSR